MSTNMTLITSVTVGSGGAASVTLPATGTIPATYTDLQVLMSVRTAGSGAGDTVRVQFNGSSSNFTAKELDGNGASAASASRTDGYIGYMNAGGSTANTFSNASLYIPNYTSSNYKSYSVDKVSEQNGTTAYAELVAGLWSNTAAITSLTFVSAGSFNIVEGSTFYLYGISNVTSTTKATGGIVSSDGTYNYHMFPYSGTFTPTQNITADYLVIAGGGGGGGGQATGEGAGGGGAGGLRSTVGTTGGGGSLESALSLTANTAYTVTVGAGGQGGATSFSGNNGSDSTFSTITATGGGAGGKYNANGATGGSGGGGGDTTRTGGAGTTNQGYAGGAGGSGLSPSNNGVGGGGGGAGAVGVAGSNSVNAAGNGGAGVTISAFANATQTGVNAYYAGGGGGGSNSSDSGYTPAIGGLGGGGNGALQNAAGSAGITNTGSGGGGGTASATAYAGGNGGSGLVIIRYAI